MRHIDWSKAPDWADGHALVAHHGITEVWVNPEQYAVIDAEDRAYAYGGGTGESMYNFTRSQIQYITPRPDRWDGTGLPPVGFDCEYLDGGEWVPCQVVAHRHLVAVVLTEDVTPALANKNELRLHRTPEQTAADERLHKVRNAATAIARTLNTLQKAEEPVAVTVIEAMIDAGYVRQDRP